MKRILLLLTLLISPCFLFAQAISFSFTPGYDMPSEGSTETDTTVYVRVSVFALAQITSVIASAGGRQTALEPIVPEGSYTGRINLNGLPGDTLHLVVTARDTLGNVGDTGVTFIYRPLVDPAVSLTFDTLADQSVARPFFPLRAVSVGNTIVVYNRENTNSAQPIFTARDSIPMLNLTDFNGKRLMLRLVATDSIGRTTRKELSVFVESSPYLEGVLSGNETISDVQYNKALVKDKATGYPVLVDLTTKQRSVPLINAPFSRAFVTRDGAAIFSNDTVYEWKNGQLVFLAQGRALSVAGDYAMWTKPDASNPKGTRLTRRNLATGAMDSVVVLNFLNDLDLAPNGMAMYAIQNDTYQSNIFRYVNGQSNAVSPSLSNRFKRYPRTDGNDVVYSVFSQLDGTRALYYYNRQSNTDVQLLDQPRDPGTGYQVKNRFMAFVRTQVALRDSLGNLRDVTSFPAGATQQIQIDLLNSRGDLIAAATDGGRQFIKYNSAPKRVASLTVTDNWGPVSNSYYDNGNWYLLAGKTLFRINVDSTPVSRITDFEKTVRPDSTLDFTRKDFDSHFSSPATLTAIKFTSLPGHGTLNWFWNPVAENSSFTAAQLDDLNYTPDSAYTGVDTIRWIAFNGVDYTPDTASIIIHVKDSVITVPQPVVTGLASAYCNAVDSQGIKIANLPSAGSGIQVTVRLDSTTVLPVKADSTFTVYPANLATGRHSIAVTFAYDTIQKRLPLSFSVTPSVTPSLDITVNVNPIITDTIPVIITVTNVNGGGKQPLYTFAWDRDFINQLQLESNNPSVTVAAAQFELGENVVYARVRTSNQCYTTQTGIDSIVINKTNITSIVDVDNPGKPVIVYPNPFHDQVSINGLQPTRTYILSLYDIQGKLLLSQRVVNQIKAEIYPPKADGSIYILRLYDEKAKKLVGSQKLVGY